MQLAFENIHLVLDIVTPVALIAVAWVGMTIRNSILTNKLEAQAYNAKVKEELVASSGEVKTALLENTAKLVQAQTVISGELSKHVMSDDMQFKMIQDALHRIENKKG